MFWAWLQNGAIGLTLLICGGSISFAEGKYDRNLEAAVKEIVARKMTADIRGTLSVNWRLPAVAAEAEVPALIEPSPSFVDSDARLSGDSILGYRMPAMTTSAIQAAQSLIDEPEPERKVRVVYF